jgi:hypothetical protein
MIAQLPDHNTKTIIAAERVWYSASFYLRRTVPAYYGEELYEQLRSLGESHPETLVLVRSDDQLPILLARLQETPRMFDHEVVLPAKNSRIAMVVVRRSPTVPSHVAVSVDAHRSN